MTAHQILAVTHLLVWVQEIQDAPLQIATITNLHLIMVLDAVPKLHDLNYCGTPFQTLLLPQTLPPVRLQTQSEVKIQGKEGEERACRVQEAKEATEANKVEWVPEEDIVTETPPACQEAPVLLGMVTVIDLLITHQHQ